jgi:hypothetical protein
MATLEQILLAVKTLGDKVIPLSEEVPKLRHRIDKVERIAEEHDRQLSKLNAPKHRDYSKHQEDDFDPDQTPHGTIVLAPHKWEQFVAKYKEQEDKRKGAEEYIQALGREEQIKKRQYNRRFRIAISTVGTLGPIVTWIMTHFFHL